ncbi:MAG: DedA family protein [Actinomycetes bacterium]|jgi:membrane-associated protein
MSQYHVLAASFSPQLTPLEPFLFYAIVAAIIFMETGLLIGFFFPGDSLLFSAGLVAASRSDINVAILVVFVFVAAFIGDQVGYIFGRHYGRPYLQRRPKLTKFVTKSENFYSKYGWWSVVIARYIPWIRTFVPPIAGISQMNYYKFLSANTLGALLWGTGITLAGFYSGSISWVKSISYGLALFFICGSLISGYFNFRRKSRD